MLNEIRFLLITAGSILIGAAVMLYFRMDKHFRAEPLHKLYMLMEYYYLKVCVKSAKGIDSLKRTIRFDGEEGKADAGRMVRLQQKEEQLMRMRSEMKSSTAGYHNSHHYNMRRMK